MTKTVYSKDCVRLHVDEEFGLIYEEWTGQVSLEEFQDALEKKLELFNEHRQSIPDLKWLNDTRGLRGLSTEAQEWAVHQFHPKLYPAGVRKIAFIVPEQVFPNLPDENLTGKMDASGEILLCYFDDFEDGANWLTTD